MRAHHTAAQSGRVWRVGCENLRGQFLDFFKARAVIPARAQRADGGAQHPDREFKRFGPQDREIKGP